MARGLFWQGVDKGELMIPTWFYALAALAAISILILPLVFLGAWCKRLSSRVRLLEAAARRACVERISIPDPITDPALDITLPRFIGSPYPSRRGP
jgi:hypothetical protein